MTYLAPHTYLKTQNSRKEQISYTPSIERIVGWTACKTVLKFWPLSNTSCLDLWDHPINRAPQTQYRLEFITHCSRGLASYPGSRSRGGAWVRGYLPKSYCVTYVGDNTLILNTFKDITVPTCIWLQPCPSVVLMQPSPACCGTCHWRTPPPLSLTVWPALHTHCRETVQHTLCIPSHQLSSCSRWH